MMTCYSKKMMISNSCIHVFHAQLEQKILNGIYQRWRSKLASPVPHVEQVPCRYDKAVFPTQNVPKLSVADYEVDISQFKINKVNINSGQFRSIYKGGDGYSREIGKMLFQVNISDFSYYVEIKLNKKKIKKCFYFLPGIF